MRAYEYRHSVGFEDTNVVGNVYFVNHLRWQGRCREMFLREHAPSLLTDLAGDLRLMTLRCSCEYFQELAAFDEIVVRMRLESMAQNRLVLRFEYVRNRDGHEEVVARGEQEIACIRNTASGPVATPVPQPLRDALRAYQ
jgi:enediyne biosynthesis thioesterase